MARLDALYTGDGSDLEFSGKRKVIAPGKYEAIIVGSEIVDNGNKTGKNLMLTHQIVKGEYKGEEIKEWLAIINPESKAQNIAQAKKARLGIILLGVKNPADSDYFLYKHSRRTHIIETDTQPKTYTRTNNEGEEVVVNIINNIIKTYHPVTGEFKTILQTVNNGGSLAPVIAHSTITNGAGGSFSVGSDDEIPF